MSNEYKKVLATVLSLCLLFSPNVQNNSEERNVAPEPVKVEAPKEDGLKLKKTL